MLVTIVVMSVVVMIMSLAALTTCSLGALTATVYHSRFPNFGKCLLQCLNRCLGWIECDRYGLLLEVADQVFYTLLKGDVLFYLTYATCAMQIYVKDNYLFFALSEYAAYAHERNEQQ